MERLPRCLFRSTAVLMVSLLLIGVLMTACGELLRAAEEAVEVEPAPPKDQEYIGVKECASCHFKQFLTWKKSKHSNTYNLLPAKYKEDAKCLKCHSTGYGKPTGFKDIKSTPNLAGNTCEMCHGPGSKHGEICKQFGKQKLSKDQEKLARDSIWRIIPTNICIECHKVQGHGESQTPKELRSKG